jgi:hypothetical protein
MAIDFMTTYAEPARKPATATRYSRRKAPIAVLLGTVIAAGLQFSAVAPAQAAPSPSSVALWTMSPDPDALTMQRSIVMTTGLVHSEGGLHIKKSKGRLTGGTEYAGEYSTQATNIRVNPAAHKVSGGLGNPAIPTIADYRPGGAAALAASSYTSIDAAKCVGGYWTPDPKATFSGVVHVPCGLSLTGGKQRTLGATFVAEGRIMVWSSKLTVGPEVSGASLISGATGEGAILFAGTKLTTRGRVLALDGNIRITSAATVLHCGAQAQVITIYRASVKVPLPDRCADLS